MCVPDMALIVEIMLMSEGFNMSKMLSRKFVILYRLCEDLLSKSKHYDWKLRAIKTTLYVAGGMKRSAPDLSEDKVPQPSHGFTCNIVSLPECIGWTTELASQQTSNPAIKILSSSAKLLLKFSCLQPAFGWLILCFASLSNSHEAVFSGFHYSVCRCRCCYVR